MVLAFYDAFEDGYDHRTCFIFSAFPAVALMIVNWIALEMKLKRKNKISFTFCGVMVFNGIVLVLYSISAMDGHSNPDTAQHMRFFALPILLAIAGPILLLPLLVIDFIKKKKPIP